MRITGGRSLRAALLGTLTLVLFAGPVQVAGATPPSAGIPPATPDVLVTDQASKRILRLDGDDRAWDASDVEWSFSPLGDPRYTDLDPTRTWIYPSEAKVRRQRGHTYLLTTASLGFAAVVEYPSGKRYWGATLSPGTSRHNPHSIELLPDGNVAVASSTGNEIRLYAASQGHADVPFTTLGLKDAHGLQWDRQRRVLWAVGGERLVELRVAGTAARPRLVTVSETPLPTPHGHDLFQVVGRPHRLWVSTGSAVYQFDTRSRTFRQDYADAARISRVGVKAVGNDRRDGQVLTTVPETGLEESWWTRKVTVHHPDGEYLLRGGGIYKARWWLP